MFELPHFPAKPYDKTAKPESASDSQKRLPAFLIFFSNLFLIFPLLISQSSQHILRADRDLIKLFSHCV